MKAPRTTAVAFALLMLAGCAGTGPGIPGQLDAHDLQLMTATAQAALETNRVGVGSNWSNPATGHLGTVTPVRTFELADGTPCRDYQVTATVVGETEIGYDTACRRADGTWVSRRFDNLIDALHHARNERYQHDARRDRYYDPRYDDPWCRWPRNRYDPWCRPRSGVSLGIGVRL